jgi:hypothetical protein
MSANGISTLGTKQAKQEAKLEIAEAKRQGKTVTEGSGTYSISGSVDPTADGYRTLNTLDINLLPTKYVGNTVVDNAAPLQAGRPWT